jgi:hypothetical protein
LAYVPEHYGAGPVGINYVKPWLMFYLFKSKYITSHRV